MKLSVHAIAASASLVALSLVAAVCILSQPFQKALRLEVSIPLEHLHAFVPGDAGYLHRVQSLLEEARCGLVPQIVPSQVCDLKFGKGAFPNTNDSICSGSQHKPRAWLGNFTSVVFLADRMQRFEGMRR